MIFQPGAILHNRYRIVKLLGQGGFGTMYRAWDTTLGRPCALKENLAYLSAIRKAVRRAARRKYPLDILEEITVEDCGKSRVLIGGLAEELHSRNLRSLYEQIYGKPPLASGGVIGPLLLMSPLSCLRVRHGRGQPPPKTRK